MTHKLSTPDQWLDLHGDILYRYAFARVRVSEIAEDLVQETLLGALAAGRSKSQCRIRRGSIRADLADRHTEA